MHFWQSCRTVVAIRPKNFRSDPEMVEKLKKNLTPKGFLRKDPLARRVQFCKPCRRKISQKGSWINQNTKRTRKMSRRFYHSKSGNARTILILCGKENSSNRSSGYVECCIDKMDKIVFFGCSKMHHWESVNEKNIVLIKGRTFFVQNVSVDTWISILSKLSESYHKTFIQDLLQIRTWEKNQRISRSNVFSRIMHLRTNWIAVLNILPERFYQFSGINFCINLKKTWFL